MDIQLRDGLFVFLTTKYVQGADERQKAMGLQYMTAETHDLADAIAKFIERDREVYVKRAT